MKKKKSVSTSPAPEKPNMPEELSIAYYEDQLRVDKASLDEQISRHARLFFDVGERAAEAEGVFNTSKDHLAQVEALLYEKYVKKAAAAAERVTETSLRNKILVDSTRVQAFEDMNRARVRAKAWEAMRDAYSARTYLLRMAVSLQEAIGFQTTGVSGSRRFASEAESRSEVVGTRAEIAKARARTRAQEA